MMNYETACNKARREARKSKEFVYVVLDDAEYGDYQTANDYDIDTYYLGANPVIAFDPYGDVAD